MKIKLTEEYISQEKLKMYYMYNVATANGQ